MNHSEKALSYMRDVKTEGLLIENFIKVYNPVQLTTTPSKGITVEFTLQNGPIKEEGVNGCQASDMLTFVRNLFISLNGDFPCKENEETISHLNQAIIKQTDRTADRKARLVEGTSQN